MFNFAVREVVTLNIDRRIFALVRQSSRRHRRRLLNLRGRARVELLSPPADDRGRLSPRAVVMAAGCQRCAS